MLHKYFNNWVNPVLMGLLILFSLPIKLDSFQQIIENILSFSFPIRLSLYTLLLPPIALFGIFFNIKKVKIIFYNYKKPLLVLTFLFAWMWIGALTSDYPKIAIKHSGRYSIYLITFLTFLFVLDERNIRKCYYVFSIIFLKLMSLTFLDWHGLIKIPEILKSLGMSIDLFQRGNFPTSFFENRNPYSIICVGVFFLGIINLKKSFFLSFLLIISSFYSIFITGSRNGIFTILICILFLVFLNFKQIKKLKFFLILVSSIILFGFSFYLSDITILKRFKNSLTDLFNSKTLTDLENLDPRFVIYTSALNYGVLNKPIIGSGTKTFGYEVFRNSKKLTKFEDEYHRSRFNAHNPLLTIWIEMGIIGIIGVIIFLWLWIKPSLRGPPILVMPILAMCFGQIFDYFVWQILFMAFQSFFFVYIAIIVNKIEERKIFQSNK